MPKRSRSRHNPYSEIPSAPPSYLSDDPHGVAIPSIQGQFTRRISYGTVYANNAEPVGPVQTHNSYYPQQQHHHHHPQPVILQPTLISTNTILQPIYVRPLLGKESCTVFCVVCQKRVATKTSSRYPCIAHLCCCLMFFSGGLCLCSPLAYCFCQPEKVTHSCSHCNSIQGIYYPD